MAERSFSQLPISSSHGGRRTLNTRRGIFPVSEYWIHAIPVIVFLCFFILWCYSNPVSVDMSDGEITSVQLLLEKTMEVRNESHVSLAIRTSSAVSPLSANHNLTTTITNHNVTKSHNATKPHKATKSHKPTKTHKVTKSHKATKSHKGNKSHNATKPVKKAKEPLAG